MKRNLKVLQIIQNYNTGKCESVSCSVVSDSAIPWTIAGQAPPPMQFSRQEYRSGQPFLSPGDLSNPEIKPESPAPQVDSLPSEPPGKPYNIGKTE